MGFENSSPKTRKSLQATGIDISHLMIEYATNLAQMQGLANAQFQVMNVTQPLAFADQTFDLVNGRLLTGALRRQQWPKVLGELRRITRPGGIVRWTEAEWGFTNSKAFDTLQCELGYLALSRADHSFSPRGRTVGTANVLRWLMQQAGYEVLGYRAHAVDYSAGTELHDSNVQNYLIFHKLYQPFLIQMQVATQGELDFLYQQMEEDMQKEDFCAVDYFLTIWGRNK